MSHAMTGFGAGGLRSRLVALGVLAALPALVLVFSTGLAHRRLAAAEAEGGALGLARLAADEHAGVVEGARQLLVTLARVPEVRARDAPACGALFAELLRVYPRYTNLGVAAPTGEVWCSGVAGPDPFTVVDRPYFQRALATRDFVVGEYQIGRASGRANVPLAYPVLAGAGAVEAILFVGADLGWLSDLASRVQLPLGTVLHVVDRAGTVVARVPDPERWVGRAAPEAAIVRAMLAQEEGTAAAPGIDGTPRLWGFAAVAGEAAGLSVGVGIPTAAAYAEADRLLARNLAGLGLVAALALVAAWVGADVFLLRRVRALVRATERLAASDLGARTGPPYGEGELGQLALAFDGMAQALAQREAARQQSEAALRASEDRYRAVVEQASEGILLVDLDTTRLLEANAAYRALLGYTLEELRALTLYEVVAHDRASIDRHIQRIVTEGRHAIGERQHRRKDGSLVDVEVSASLVSYGDRRVQCAVVRDITARKRAEAALQESHHLLQEALADLQAMQDHLIQQERLHALGQMASGIAHDFNNALQPVVGFSELLLLRPEALADRDTARAYLQIIHTAAGDAAGVVSRLREFYRPREASEVLAPVDLHRVIEQTVALTQPKWKDQAQANGTTITVVPALEPVPAVAGNEGELRQALTNLVLNAVDAMPGGGVLTLRTRAEGRHVRIEVSDTGTGMAEEVRRRCLEPFFTTKGARGSGLGLAMVHGIVQRHAGSIEVQSAPGEGTTVGIRLPVPAQGTTSGTPADATAGARPARILVVDDEPLLRRLLAAYLTGDGHAVETASDGREGWARFRAGRFDLVITDRAMPGMNGEQLAAAVKQASPATPVILLTGYGELMESAGERPPGVDLVLAKPVTLGRLRAGLAGVQAGEPAGPARPA